ncbi:TPA: glycosyltransferase family 52, partial [Haemophilus influenzae]
MNLILCCTPLQVLIARKIIELHPNEQFFGVIFGGVWDKKRTLYASKLSEVCSDSMNIDTGKDLKGFDFLKLMRQLKNKITHKGFDKVFLANLNSLWLQTYLSHVSFKELYTFDDGSDNIFPHPNLLREPDTFKYKLIKAFIGDKYSVNKLFKKIKKHYTVYPNYKNIVSNIEPISLWDNKVDGDIDGKVSFFIGQPLLNTKEENISLIKKLKEQ